jgi:serine/threonine protein kinase
MAAVYQARDQRLPTKFWAIKELSTSQLATPQELREAIQAFQREAQMLANLNHAHLPKVSDFFAEGGRYYLVMDFIEGRTLEEMLAGRGNQPFPESTVFQWAEQLCDALSYLHTQNPPIIFRDLKPGNIMITPAGQVFLIDFGIARLFKPGQTRDTVPLGSPGYAPPEQYGKGQTDARSDVYALGVTLHQLLTGWDPSNRPFQLPAARQLNPAISPHVDQALQKATRVDRNLRFSSVEEFRQALMPAPGPTPVSAAPILNAAPAALDFGTVTPPAQPLRGFQVRNRGGGTLTGSVVSQAAWLTVRPPTFQGDTAIEVQADVSQLRSGQSHSAGLLVQSNGGTTTVTAQVTVSASPQFWLPILAGLGVVLVAVLMVAGAMGALVLARGRATPPTVVGVAKLPTVTPGAVIPPMATTPPSPPPVATTATRTPPPGLTPPTQTPPPTWTPTPSRTVEERAVRQVVQRWHDIKVRAVHDRRADELSTVLASTALISETKGIEWLTDSDAYWDLTLHSMEYESIDFSPDLTRARVIVIKDETGRFYMRGKYYPKTSYEHDVYRALYDMEKIGGQWKIVWKENLNQE